MTFLVIAVVAMMLSAGAADYVDHSNGYEVFETTIEIKTDGLRKSDTSPNKYAIPDKVFFKVSCLDYTPGTDITIDEVKLTPTDSWYLATGVADDMTVAILHTKAAEGSLEVCRQVRDAERHLNKKLKSERRA